MRVWELVRFMGSGVVGSRVGGESARGQKDWERFVVEEGRRVECRRRVQGGVGSVYLCVRVCASEI